MGLITPPARLPAFLTASCPFLGWLPGPWQAKAPAGQELKQQWEDLGRRMADLWGRPPYLSMPGKSARSMPGTVFLGLPIAARHLSLRREDYIPRHLSLKLGRLGKAGGRPPESGERNAGVRRGSRPVTGRFAMGLPWSSHGGRSSFWGVSQSGLSNLTHD